MYTNLVLPNLILIKAAVYGDVFMTDRPRMMVVEDDRDTAEMLAAYFEAQGYAVTPVAWGADAVRQAQEGAAPDLILLDIRLPDMDGFEVCKRLRSHRRTQYVPIIFLTEKRERGDRLSGLELGAVDYITKPFDVQDLRLRVRNILRRSKYQTLVHPVTGLPNQELVDERLNVPVEPAQLGAADHSGGRPGCFCRSLWLCRARRCAARAGAADEQLGQRGPVGSRQVPSSAR